jgi:hypothetical protein
MTKYKKVSGDLGELVDIPDVPVEELTMRISCHQTIIHSIRDTKILIDVT